MATETKSNALKKLVQTQLKTVMSNVYFELAPDSAMFPHCVFNFQNINLGDLSRDDVILEVDIYDRKNSTQNIDSYADSVEALFNASNLPQTTILPTFFRDGRMTIVDSTDKKIRRRKLRFIVQNYERS